MPTVPPASTWRPLLDSALAEDLGPGDVTTDAIFPVGAKLRARIEAREPLVLCGSFLVEAVFEALGDVRLERCAVEGSLVAAGHVVARLEGSAHQILAGERTALNFLGRLSGVATETRRFVREIEGTAARIVDTRKTLPGYRSLDKYAVRVGGGENHRAGLYDAILIKDNHIAAAGGVREAVQAARTRAPRHLWVQVEVESASQAEAALAAGADSLLLDNRTPAELGELVALLGDRTVLEASGGVRLENVRAIAASGVARISIGALTHSARSADVALEVEGTG